jgi:hypothetical protein
MLGDALAAKEMAALGATRHGLPVPMVMAALHGQIGWGPGIWAGGAIHRFHGKLILFRLFVVKQKQEPDPAQK